MNAPAPEERPIAVRAYCVPPTRKDDDKRRDHNKKGGAPWGPSPLSLTLDIETTTGAEQRPRVGNYQVHRDGELIEEGLFYDPDALSTRELRRLRDYVRRHNLVLRTVTDFDEQIVYRLAYRQNALIIGANMSFDLARLAYHHEPAKGRKMGGGFSFALRQSWPHLRIKHLSRTVALIDFASPGGQRTARSWRRRGKWRNTRRGFFCDVLSLGTALTGRPHSLASLGELLDTPHRKTDAEHGRELDARYLRYLRNDVQVTWECYERLATRYRSFGLNQTPVSAIYSEASIGKACLREMGVQPWRALQPDVPPSLVGLIMSSYFGGRSEVHLRRLICRVLYCDFLSMYATISVLTGLWRFVTAQGIDWHEATAETQAFVEQVSLADLARPETWRKLWVLVQVEPQADLFPVRAPYDAHNPAYSIGLNYLTTDKPIWVTLADVIAAKLLSGKAPTIRRALAFTACERQQGLKPIDILGNPDYRIDPNSEDFYLRLIELRSSIKRRRSALPAGPERERLDAEQQALKIAANAACYGIFVELNVVDYARKREVTYYTTDEQPRTAKLASVEEPGRFFHPLLATLTTAGARLMLALAESLATSEGLSWAFCDTDSMALACPPGVTGPEFRERCERVRRWFEQLNPYHSGDELFKVEDANHSLDDPDHEDPLYCFAVSDKRYVLFNIDHGAQPVLRKASAHGLGYLLAPYPEKKAPDSVPAPRVRLTELGVERWQHDLWYRIVEAAAAGHSQQVDFDGLPGFDAVAISRYAATRPHLLHWFDTYNEGKPYDQQVRPFGFLNAYQVKSRAERVALTLALSGDGAGNGRSLATWEPKVVSPFNPDPAVAVLHCFDRDTGEPVPAELLRTYRDAVARYHLHPETKFIGGDYTDSGVLERRHIRVPETNGVRFIGKEANRWEERSQTGDDPEGQIHYGTSGGGYGELRAMVREACDKYGLRALAREAQLSAHAVGDFASGTGETSDGTVEKLRDALPRLSSMNAEAEAHQQAVLERVRERCRRETVTGFAERAEVDRATLSAVLAGRRSPSDRMLSRLDD